MLSLSVWPWTSHSPLVDPVSSTVKSKKLGCGLGMAGSLCSTSHSHCPHFLALTGHGLSVAWRAVINPEILLTKLRAPFPLEKSSLQE